jgi:1,4-dihydroxy-2-naphthoate octaprenyltransferase
MSKIRPIMGPMRVLFLILMPACVILGVATAVHSGAHINLLYVLLVTIGALGTHISINAVNECDDFRSGLDTHPQRILFSGGSDTLPANPAIAGTALTTALVCAGIVALIGLYFTWPWGLALLPVEALGMLVIIAHTPYLTCIPFLCLIAPWLGFEPLMVMGTHFALTRQYSRTALIASMIHFFLVSNFLLLYQFPDVEADKTVGRQHFPILIGRPLSS